MSEETVPRLMPRLSVVKPAPIDSQAEEEVVSHLRQLLAMAERGDIVGIGYVCESADGAPFTCVAGSMGDPGLAIGAMEILKHRMICLVDVGQPPILGGDDGAA